MTEKPLTDYEAIVFDLDGTLIDSAPDLRLAANVILAARGKSPLSLDQIRSFIGNGVPKLIERVLAASGLVASGEPLTQAIEDFRVEYETHPVVETAPYPGVPQLLAELAAKGISLGICTNKPAVASGLVLARLGLKRHFGSVIGGDTLPETKPDPAPLLRTIADLGARPDATLYVGDSETDEATALNTGVDFALFTGGYRKKSPSDFRAIFTFDDYATLRPA